MIEPLPANQGTSKRKGDSNNTPDPKRIQASELMHDSYCPGDDFYYTPPEFSMPHHLANCTILGEFSENVMFIEVLVDKVINHAQLKTMIEDLIHSLRNACASGVLGTFACKMHDLIHCPDFIQACLDTFRAPDDVADDDPIYCYDLPVSIEIYKAEKQPQEQMKSLREDQLLYPLLEETDFTLITRGVLSVLFCYWSDDAFHKNVCQAIKSFYKETRPPPPTSTVLRSETVVDIDFPASVEGLKEAFRTKYPVDEAKIMCEQLYRNKHIEEVYFSHNDGSRINSFMFTLRTDRLTVHMVGFSDDIWL